MKLVHALHIAMVYTCIRPSWQQQKDFLLVAFEKTIERIDPVTGHSELVPISNKAGGQIINIDFDVKHNCLFYSTCCPGEIIQKCLDNRAEEMVIVENAEISTGLSYDWVSELLYFTTAEAQHKIEIVKIVHADGNGNRTQMKNYMRRTIVGNLNSRILVRDILVDPVNRYLFWVDISPEQSPHIVQYTAESPTIWRAYLDGSHAQKIHTCTFEMNPIRLSLRYDMNQIYWTGQEWYASSDLNGDIIIKIYLRPDPDHIAVTKDHLYWSNSKTQSVYVRNRDVRADISILHQGFPSQGHLKAMKMISTRHQSLNGDTAFDCRCSHICVRSANGSSHCLCPDGTKHSGKESAV